MHHLKEVLVTAKRIKGKGIEPSHIPANVTVITQEEIINSGATDISEVIALVEGVNFSDVTGFGLGGGLGANINLRNIGASTGSTSTIVLVDGFRLNQVSIILFCLELFH